MALLVAQMWDGDAHMGGDGWWWVMGAGWLVSLAFAGFLVYLLLRRHTGSEPQVRSAATAERLLAERFAGGEIDEDEFRRRRDALRE
jgi:putative membrane protein